MIGKAKKIVSLAYKEKLLTEIAHYERRIEEALNKRKQNSFEEESIEDIINPYKLNLKPSQYELKQREASLSDRASMTLELSMLTIMQSEVNVMVTPPELRKPVLEDGIWHEVAAECKIDLVSFTITFYAHKPHRKFAPTRYRNVAVALVKPAHQKELAQSILPKLQLPNLALQVLQSYATAFRSRRTTLLELAERYGDKLRMQAMPEGGYRVKFLDLLQVEWSLENLWSPVVPFGHRMKFEVEYMPKDYIQAIGKLYKQFKDPSLNTSERTLVLTKILEICLQAAGPARELQESFESDPETAGRLHERRTTIDQDPDVPNVGQPPKPTGKENKPDRKTSMAPPKTIPKKAKKTKANKDTDRKSVKRTTESEGSDAKRTKIDEGNDNASRIGLKGGRNGSEDKNEGSTGKTKDVEENGVANEEEAVNSEKNGPKKSKVASKIVKAVNKDIVTLENEGVKRGDGKTAKSKASGNTVGDAEINNPKKKDSAKASTEASSKGSKKDARNSDKNAKSKDTENNTVKSKTVKEDIAKNVKSNTEIADGEKTKNDKMQDKIAKSKETGGESNVASANKTAEKKTSALKDKPTGKTNVKSKEADSETTAKSERVSQNLASKNVAKKVANDEKIEGKVASTKPQSKNDNVDEVVTSKKKNAISEVVNTKSKAINKDNAQGTKENEANAKVMTKKVHNTDTVSKTGSKTPKESEAKLKVSKNLRDTNKEDVLSAKDAQNTDKEKAVKKRDTFIITKADVQTAPKNSTTKPKEVKQKQPVNDKEKNTKITDKVAEKRKLKETPIETNKAVVLKEKASLGDKKKVTNSKTNEETTEKNKTTVEKTSKTKPTDKNVNKDEVLSKKMKLSQPGVNAKTNNVQAKTSTNTVKQNPKVPDAILKENTNRHIQKATEKKAQINKKPNMLNVTITKPKIIPLSKLPVEKQTKIADKLKTVKTKIPMMKSKMTFSSLGAKLKGNIGKISKEESKIPQKSLPVFKRVANNMPTRFSPRKMPAFKPSSRGFSSK